MMHPEFAQQMSRLEENFKGGHFTRGRMEIIWKQVSDMDVYWFSRLVDKMIGEMRQPPMPSDFRDAAYRERQSKFNKEVDEAAKSWNTGEFNGLPQYLNKIGAKNLNDAVQKEIQRIRNGDDDFPEPA